MVPQMRLAARILALVYSFLAVAGPLAHAAEAAQRPSPAVEAEHGSGCTMGHDPATCAMAQLGRAGPFGPPAHGLALPPTRPAACLSGGGEFPTRIAPSPARARAPPPILFA